MTVATICSRDIVSLHHDEPLQKAARLMRDHHVGTVVVTEVRDDGTHVVGLVTDRDLAIEVLARGLEGGAVAIGALVGAGPLLSVAEQADLGEAIAIMHAGGVRRLLVRDGEGHLVGVLSFDDVLRVCGAQIAGLAGLLGKGLERESANASPLGTTAPAAPPRRPVPVAPRLRVPAMGTAGWHLPTQLGR